MISKTLEVDLVIWQICIGSSLCKVLSQALKQLGKKDKQSERGRCMQLKKKVENKVYGNPSEGVMNSDVEKQGRKTSWEREPLRSPRTWVGLEQSPIRPSAWGKQILVNRCFLGSLLFWVSPRGPARSPVCGKGTWWASQVGADNFWRGRFISLGFMKCL